MEDYDKFLHVLYNIERNIKINYKPITSEFIGI